MNDNTTVLLEQWNVSQTCVRLLHPGFLVPHGCYTLLHRRAELQHTWQCKLTSLALVRTRQRQWDRGVCPLLSPCWLWISSQTTFLLNVCLSQCNSLNRLLIHLFCLSLSVSGSSCSRSVFSMLLVKSLFGGVASLYISAPPPTEAWKLEQATPSFISFSLSFTLPLSPEMKSMYDWKKRRRVGCIRLLPY